jgi:small subunit ribosomal protein S13
LSAGSSAALAASFWRPLRGAVFFWELTLMPRISGVDIPGEKQIRISLTYLYGVGHGLSREVLQKVGVDPFVKARDLSEEELGRIAKMLEDEYVIEGRLRRQLAQNIQRLKEIQCYRGLRHRVGLPVRGQRTKTNARTRKGPRKVVATKKSVKAMR